MPKYISTQNEKILARQIYSLIPVAMPDISHYLSSIKSALLDSSVEICYRPQTGSTNDDLKRLAHTKAFTSPILLTVDRQISGRGTRGRVWRSMDQSLVFSLGFVLSDELRRIPSGLLSIAAAMSCADALTHACEEKVSVKWPNDIWTAGGKAGGILLEAVRDMGGAWSLVVGVGLNLEVPFGCVTGGGWPIRALRLRVNPRDSQIKGELLGMIARRMLSCFGSMTAHDAAEICRKWPLYDPFFGQEIAWKELDTQNMKQGIDCGIDHTGRLMMRGRGEEMLFLSGELVSLSRRKGF